MIVALEGVPGAGKTTLLREISALCRRRAIAHVAVQEFPTSFLNGAIARQRRVDPTLRLHQGQQRGVAQTLLIAAVHAYKWEAAIQPALDRGCEFVLIDRYVDSLVAFQSVILPSLGFMRQERARKWVRHCVKPIPPADIVLHIAPPVGIALSRKQVESDEITEALHDEYQHIFSRRNIARVIVAENVRPAREEARELLERLLDERGTQTHVAG